MIRVNKNNYRLFAGGKQYGTFQVEEIQGWPGVGNVHIWITRFSHNVLHRMQREEESLMSYIKKSGYNSLISLTDETTVNRGDIKLWKRFVTLFGFEKPKQMIWRTL